MKVHLFSKSQNNENCAPTVFQVLTMLANRRRFGRLSKAEPRDRFRNLET